MTYQSNFNGAERAQRAKVVEQTVANSAAQVDSSFYKNRPAQKLLQAETRRRRPRIRIGDTETASREKAGQAEAMTSRRTS